MSKKNIVVVTGGAGFVGSNLIKELAKDKSIKLISIDNYSTGKIKNHIKNKNIKYIRSNTLYVDRVLKNHKNKIIAIFHFGEFSRIFQSFKNFDKCIVLRILYF